MGELIDWLLFLILFSSFLLLTASFFCEKFETTHCKISIKWTEQSLLINGKLSRLIPFKAMNLNGSINKEINKVWDICALNFDGRTVQNVELII